MQKQNATFRVNRQMWNKFNEVCKKNNTTRGEVLREKIQEYINNNGR